MWSLNLGDRPALWLIWAVATLSQEEGEGVQSNPLVVLDEPLGIASKSFRTLISLRNYKLSLLSLLSPHSLYTYFISYDDIKIILRITHKIACAFTRAYSICLSD